MTARTPRYQYARCACPCAEYVLVDTATHTALGTTTDAWDASVIADRLERGLPVAWADEPELSVRTPRAVVHGLLLGFGCYVAIVAVFAVLGGAS